MERREREEGLESSVLDLDRAAVDALCEYVLDELLTDGECPWENPALLSSETSVWLLLRFLKTLLPKSRKSSALLLSRTRADFSGEATPRDMVELKAAGSWVRLPRLKVEETKGSKLESQSRLRLSSTLSVEDFIANLP